MGREGIAEVCGLEQREANLSWGWKCQPLAGQT